MTIEPNHTGPCRNNGAYTLTGVAGILLFVLVFTGCDGFEEHASSSDDMDAVSGYDAAAIARAEALDVEDSTYRDPVVAFMEAPKPLLQFASMEAFEEMVAARERLAAWGEEPLEVHASLKSYLDYDLVVPPVELALADEHGRLVIAEQLFQLQGEVSVVSDLETGAVLEEIPMKAGTEAASKINPNGEDAYDYARLGGFEASNGRMYHVRMVASHNAYRTWTGRRRANAMTELQVGPTSTGPWQDLKPGYLFPNAWVEAKLRNRDDKRCETETASVQSSIRRTKEVHVKVGNGRGPGSGVSWSQHGASVEGSRSYLYLEGRATNCDSGY